VILVQGGLVVGPNGTTVADVLIDGPLVMAVGPELDPAGAEVIDAGGCWVGPGFVDLHAHLREPGAEWKEDIATASAAGVAGGYTALVAMPNTEPATDAGHLARYLSHRGEEVGLLQVIPAGALTAGRRGEQLAHLDELWAAGVRVFTDDGRSVARAGLLRQAMEYLVELGGVVAQHAEDLDLAQGGHMHEGAVSSLLGVSGLPALAEEIVVARDIALARLTGCRYHVQHVSTAGTVELVAAAKAEGLPVTAEVTPHHLYFDHQQVLGLDPAFKMYPPLRGPEDVAAVRDGLRNGVIDCVATDHAPHAAHECEVPFEEAPRGVIGLETAASAVLDATTLDAASLFRVMSAAPAQIGRLADQGQYPKPGSPANLCLFDPQDRWTPTVYRSKSANSPFTGRSLGGRVKGTIFRGAVSYHEVMV